jgi:hypothetical protein
MGVSDYRLSPAKGTSEKKEMLSDGIQINLGDDLITPILTFPLTGGRD